MTRIDLNLRRRSESLWGDPLWTGLFKIDIGSDPIVRCRPVALAGNVFGEKYISGNEGHRGAIAEANVDATREGNNPAASRCAMPVNNMRRKIISKEESQGRAGGIEELG
jgi:hypothetical protein